MILFGSTLSPYVRKVAAYMREKGLEFELQPTGFPNHSPEFCAASPFKKMPALQDADYCLSDSSAIIHYLEAKHPTPELIPSEPSGAIFTSEGRYQLSVEGRISTMVAL